MGIGQPNFADYRYRIVDYLTAMNMYEYIMASKKPEKVASFDTIIYPFDTYSWLCIIFSILAEFLILIFAQNLWSYMYSSTNPEDYIYQDFFIATAFFPRRKLITWIQRPGYGTRRGMILKWIVLGSVLIMAYKSILLSSLVPIRYEATIDTLEDMEQSGLPLLILKSTAFQKLIASDPRDTMKQVYKRSILFPYSPAEPWGVPGWVMAM